MQWEAEFFALQDSNNKLADALREANAAATQWRHQVEAQRAEAERLRQRVRALFTDLWQWCPWSWGCAAPPSSRSGPFPNSGIPYEGYRALML